MHVGGAMNGEGQFCVVASLLLSFVASRHWTQHFYPPSHLTDLHLYNFKVSGNPINKRKYTKLIVTAYFLFKTWGGCSCQNLCVYLLLPPLLLCSRQAPASWPSLPLPRPERLFPHNTHAPSPSSFRSALQCHLSARGFLWQLKTPRFCTLSCSSFSLLSSSQLISPSERLNICLHIIWPFGLLLQNEHFKSRNVSLLYLKIYSLDLEKWAN